ncbi:MAG: hypothetical protein WCA38_17460, partial [Candidatus Acidiferrales bacterium]
KHRDPKTNPHPNTMCRKDTPGEDHGSGHFYLAKTRTFLLCVDMKTSQIEDKPNEDMPERNPSRLRKDLNLAN